MEAEDMMEYLDTIGKKIILIGCYLSVKDDEFLMSLKNLETIISYKDIKNIQKILLSLKDKTKFIQKSASIQTNLSNFKKEKLKNYLKNI
jgi:tRNA A37 methylthiotransferase MiaB